MALVQIGGMGATEVTIDPIVMRCSPPRSGPAASRWWLWLLVAGGAWLVWRALDDDRERRRGGEGPEVKRNPRSADELYRGFHWGRQPRGRSRVQLSPEPAELVQLGQLEAVTYSTVKGRERAHWEHEFAEKGGRRPVLAMDARTQRLHIVGGTYRVEDRGIVG